MAQSVIHVDDVSGTPGYMAPECLADDICTTKADMWALGVIIYMLLVGFPPFYHEDVVEVNRRFQWKFLDPGRNQGRLLI